MRIALCEDIPIVRTVFKQSVAKYDSQILVDLFENGSNFLSKFQSKTIKYDCLFLDIDLPDINGVEIARFVRDHDEQIPIIFFTSHDEYMPDVFRLHTFDYLVKPIDREELEIVLNNVSKLLNKRERSLDFSYKHTNYSIPLHDILFFEKIARKVKLVTESGEYFFYSSTEDLMIQLSEDFIRTHASYIINCKYVVGYSSTIITLKGFSSTYEIPVSRKFRKTIKSKIIQNFRFEL